MRNIERSTARPMRRGQLMLARGIQGKPAPAPTQSGMGGKGGAAGVEGKPAFNGQTLPQTGMGGKGGAAPAPMKKGGKVIKKMSCGGKAHKMKKGGSVSSCSKRADGCAVKGKTKGRMV